jgi:tRNA A37 methylthiotransferase MiaB
MTRFHLATLGCKVNQYESQSLREAWTGQGCVEAADAAGAEVVVINSCAVTAGALADLRQLVARVRRANPAARIVVTGCAAQAVRDEVAAIAGVDCIVPQAEKEALLAGLPLADLRSAAASGKASARSASTDSAAKEIKISVGGQDMPIPPGEESEERGAAGSTTAQPGTMYGSSLESAYSQSPRRTEPSPERKISSPRKAGPTANHIAISPLPPRPAGLTTDHSGAGSTSAASRASHGRRAYPAFAVAASPRARAQVKVQDGCSHGCTYCIVPLARGGAVSREPDAVLEECRRLLAAGWRELVLSGINLRQYHADKRNFWGLLRFLEEHLAPEWADRARLRVSSLDPGQLGSEALETLAASRLACPHLHLSLQAGSPGVLARMNRAHYAPCDILDFLAGLGRAWPRLGLGADLLTGFPGETAVEFEETRALVAALPLTYAHVFPFSPRPGTPAADLPSQVGPEEKKERAAVLRRLAGRKKAAFLGRISGIDELHMVLEDPATGRGTCEYGADCRLAAVPAGAVVRLLLRVRPIGLTQSGLSVEPLDDAP